MKTPSGIAAARELCDAGLANNGRLRLSAVARRFALRAGTSIEAMAWEVLEALRMRAIYESHFPSAELYFALISEEGGAMFAKGGGATVNVQQNNVTVGMPALVPEYTAGVARVIAELGVQEQQAHAAELSKFLE